MSQAASFATNRPEYWRDKAARASKSFFEYFVFVRGYLPADHHMVIIERLLYGGRLELILGWPDAAKCMLWSDMLTLADGTRVEVSRLAGLSFPLLTMTEAGPVRVMASAAWSKVEPVYRITSESGRQVERNGRHPFWTARTTRSSDDWQTPLRKRDAAGRLRLSPAEWVPLEELRPGDLVAVPTAFPAASTGDMPEAEVLALAYLIAEGGVIGAAASSSVTFTQMPGRVLEECRQAIADLGGEMVPLPKGRGGYTHYVRRAGARRGGDWRTRPPNPLAELLKQHNLAGKHSRDKRVPSAIFALRPELLRLFLNRLYACDGTAGVYASKGGSKGTKIERACISFTSASEGLVRDLLELLLRFGVNGRITKASWAAAWKLDVDRAADVETFGERIGIFGKEEAVERCRAFAARRPRSQQWRSTGLPAGLAWERVKAIELVGDARTVSVEVPGHHTYLTTFFEHNSTIGIAWLEWMLGRDPNLRCLIASEVATGVATTIVSDVAGTIETNERYIMSFGELKDPTGRQPWSTREFFLRPIVTASSARGMRMPVTPRPPFPWLLPRGRDMRRTGRHATMKAVSPQTGYAGARCEIIVCDDLVSDRVSRSQKLTDQVFASTHQKLLGRMTPHPANKMVIFGQHYGPRDFYTLIRRAGVCVFDSNPEMAGLQVLERGATTGSVTAAGLG